MLATNDPDAPCDTSACLAFCCCNFFCGCFALIQPCGLRGNVRRRWNMPADDCGDCCTVCCCAYCAIGQHTIEIRDRLHAEKGKNLVVNVVHQGQPQQPVMAKAVPVGQPQQADMER